MKNLFLLLAISCFSFSAVAQLAPHTNAGFSVVAGLGEGKAFTTYPSAVDRIVSGFKSPVLSKTFEDFASQCMQNAEVTYMGGDVMPADSIANVLLWLKDHPEDSKDFKMRVFKLSAGTSYTFMTLSVVNGKLAFGKQIVRTAHEGEWALEMFGQMFCSTWCLNLFPSTGKIVKATPPAARPASPIDGPKVDLSFPGFPQQEYRQERMPEQMATFHQMFAVYGTGGNFVRNDYAKDRYGQWITIEVPASQVPWIITKYPPRSPCGCATEVTYYQRG